MHQSVAEVLLADVLGQYVLNGPIVAVYCAASAGAVRAS
jgi:hypothetical protein